MTSDEFYFVEDTFMGRTALLDAFAQSDLDMNGFHILNAQNFGTVMSIGLAMPVQFSVSGSPVTESGTISVNWVLGGDPIPIGVLPYAKTGPLHGAGIVPDPGMAGNPTDYLARDMSYRPIPAGGTGGGEVNENPYPYQPFVPNPVLSVGTPTTGTAGQSLYPITVTDALAGAVLFYSINNSSGGFAPYTAPFNLNSGQVGYSYGAKIGYTNSEVIFVQAPSAPGGEVVTGDDGLPASGDDAANVTVGGPAPPGGLIATVAPAQVTLSWYASTGATGYTVNRGTTSKNYNTTFTTTGTGYVDTAVTSGTKYFYAVTATETGMSSGYSNEVSATPS